MSSPSVATLMEAARFLADRRLYGLVWMDEALLAAEKFGELVDFVPIGKSVTQSVLPLLGFDEAIVTLRRRPNSSVAIPNVLMDSTERDGLRMNLAVYWIPAESRYLLMVARAVSRLDIEVILAAQVRARAIAEADVVAKSRLIAKANEELTRANQDLQEFAFVISHDLRAPLRALRYFASDAAEAVAQADAQAAAAHLERVRDQAKRMAAMLTGLLEYSRIGRKLEALEKVDTEALIHEIVASIERSSTVQIDVEGKWPVIETLVQPLDIVLRNLIDNAVKHHDRSDGSIIVHAEDDDAHWIFSVADDGPGIHTEWHQAIFVPFRRIADTENAPEGSGIGLALVKKTIEWFGGQITVLSDPSRQRGTTFRIYWPKELRRTGQ
ncbi:MAG: sensor histidine kinase [Hyphomicrobiaceae bacterium]